MASEPRLLPTYPAEVVYGRYYCFLCDQHRLDANSMRAHSTATHDIEIPAPGVDYGDGEQVIFIQRQRALWEDGASQRFALELESLRGSDDFVFEAGGARDA